MMRDGSVSVSRACAGAAGLRGWGGVLLAVAATAVMTFAGCRKPVPTSRPSEVAYDPRTDPLVNPPTLLEPAPADASLMESDETLFLHLDGSPNTLTPLFLSTGVEQHVAGTIFTGPFTIDKDMKWRLDEDVVESFEESGDHMEFTLRLKPGLRWHDGAPFTAHDIVYSFEQIRDPRVPAQTEKSSVEPIRECKALDDRTVKYVMREAIATARWALSFAIVPRHVFEKDKENNPDLKSGSYYAQLGRAPIGNGRYRFVEWKENDKIVVERWDGYSGRKPPFKRVVFRIIPDNNVTLLSFEKQDIDAIERLSSQQFARETNTESFKKVGYKGWDTEWAYGYIGWNMDGSNPFFGDRRVRYAMTHALNIPLIIEKLTYNLASQSYGIYHPKSWMFNPEVKLLPYDLARSAQLLDEAGWQVDSQDGWRYKEVNGRRVRFEFTLLVPQGSSVAPQIAAMLQEGLKRVGVDLKTRVLEWATFHEKVMRHEFQAQISGWGTGADPDMGWNLWRTEEYKTGRNYGGYSNPRVDELFARGRREFDFEARRKIYQEIHKILYDDQPYLWINDRPLLAAFNKRIRGVQFCPRGVFGFDPGFDGWWVPKGQGRHVALLP